MRVLDLLYIIHIYLTSIDNFIQETKLKNIMQHIKDQNWSNISHQCECPPIQDQFWSKIAIKESRNKVA